jgi:hypothetical protein
MRDFSITLIISVHYLCKPQPKIHQYPSTSALGLGKISKEDKVIRILKRSASRALIIGNLEPHTLPLPRLDSITRLLRTCLSVNNTLKKRLVYMD